MPADLAPHVSLALPGERENVAVVRQALGGVAEAVSLDPDVLTDVKTAVSEACNNVVLHAYAGDQGPLNVDVWLDESSLSVVVRDQGQGVRPKPERDESDGLGVGLSLITALSDHVEFLNEESGGTTVRMAFGAELDTTGLRNQAGCVEVTETDFPGANTLVSVCTGPLAGPVLGSVVGMLGARAGLTVERLSDAQLATDTVAAKADAAVRGDRVHLAANSNGGSLDLMIGPLEPDGADRLVDGARMPGLGATSIFERVADDVQVERDAGDERLRLRFAAAA